MPEYIREPLIHLSRHLVVMRYLTPELLLWSSNLPHTHLKASWEEGLCYIVLSLSRCLVFSFIQQTVGTAYVLGCLSLQAVHSSNKWKKRVRSFCFLLVVWQRVSAQSRLGVLEPEWPPGGSGTTMSHFQFCVDREGGLGTGGHHMSSETSVSKSLLFLVSVWFFSLSYHFHFRCMKFCM